MWTFPNCFTAESQHFDSNCISKPASWSTVPEQLTKVLMLSMWWCSIPVIYNDLTVVINRNKHLKSGRTGTELTPNSTPVCLCTASDTALGTQTQNNISSSFFFFPGHYFLPCVSVIIMAPFANNNLLTLHTHTQNAARCTCSATLWTLLPTIRPPSRGWSHVSQRLVSLCQPTLPQIKLTQRTEEREREREGRMINGEVDTDRKPPRRPWTTMENVQ